MKDNFEEEETRKLPFKIIRALNKFRGKPLYIVYDLDDNWLGRIVWDKKRKTYIIEAK